MHLVSNYVLSNRENFYLQLLLRFKDIAASVVGSFSSSHPVYLCRPGSGPAAAAAEAMDGTVHPGRIPEHTNYVTLVDNGRSDKQRLQQEENQLLNVDDTAETHL